MNYYEKRIEMAIKPKVVKAKPEKVWDEKWNTLTDEIITNVSKESVHYSFKYINSILQGGIRLSKENAITNIPYISGITQLAFEDLPVDYYNQFAPKSSGVVFSCMGFLETKDDITNEKRILFDVNNKASFELGTADLSGKNSRLRQILIPTKNGKYLSTTPISPAGFNSLISKVNKLQLENGKTKTKLKNVLLAYGGTKGQNVGRFASKKETKALVMNAPTELPALRYAYSVYYKGVQFIPPYNSLIKLKELVDNHDVVGYTNKKSLALKELLKSVYDQSNTARDTLKEFKKDFFDESNDCYTLDDANPEKYFINNGLINKSERTKEWKNKFAVVFVKQLTGTSFIYNKTTQSLNLDDNETEQLISEVIKLL